MLSNPLALRFLFVRAQRTVNRSSTIAFIIHNKQNYTTCKFHLQQKTNRFNFFFTFSQFFHDFKAPCGVPPAHPHCFSSENAGFPAVSGLIFRVFLI